MTRPPDPYSAAVEEIRRRIRSGRYVQGEQLRVSDISADLRLSGSPVREALSRLAGEGLIEDRRGAGYFAWRLDAVDLDELYGLQAALLWAAVEAGGVKPASQLTGLKVTRPDPEVDALERAEAILGELVRAAHSQALLQAHLRLADRLAPARRVEHLVIGDAAAEQSELAKSLDASAEAAVRDWIGVYRLRRRRHAPAIVAAMRAAAEGRRRI